MKKVLLISPHFDDAVLSAGQFLSGRPNADVITVFGGTPEVETSTPYDLKCGFKRADDAIAVRKNEDNEALALLRANPIHFDFLDDQYIDGRTQEEIDEIYNAIVKQINNNNYEFILAPLGLGHPDHVLLANCVYKIKAFEHLQMPVYFWEDLPIRVVEPELVPKRLEHFGLAKREFVGDGPIANKIRALSCYRSQIGTGILDPYLMYVPERFWKV